MTPITRRRFIARFPGAAAWGAGAAATAAGAPAPYGAVPSARQLAWHELEVYAFLHFTINTFTDKEWGYGDESPALFAPSAFDADAIVEALKAGGMKGVILTAKHHDGFCLWPTRTTAHSVNQSPWRQGKGDVVKELAEAAGRAGLKFGVYLSPWDRNSPRYARPEYVALYREQLRELLTGYGPVFEVWHDGANGGDGYYGGAREKRVIDKRTYYEWPRTWEMVRQLQPGAVIFSDVGPDIRWVGNEKGFANETCWATYSPRAEDGGLAAPGLSAYREATTGHRNGAHWMPAECDVSIRPGWFWHEKQNGQVKTPDQLLDLYYRSVGHGASFLLNVPPDRRGLLHEVDVASLAEFGRRLRETFARNLAEGARMKASSSGGRAWRAGNLIDGSRRSFWMAAEGATAAEVELELRGETAFNVVRLREFLPLGQRVDEFALDGWANGAWVEFGRGTSIGNCRLVRTGRLISARRVRLRIVKSAAPPAMAEFSLCRESA